jgi:hypothetical protein
MLVMRVRDDYGYELNDFDLVFTANGNQPDRLPAGFFADRQRNQRSRGTITYFLNADRLLGCPRRTFRGSNKTARERLDGITKFGMQITPRPSDGYVHYLPGQLSATARNLAQLIRRDGTTLIDVVLRRRVRAGVYRLTTDTAAADFRKQPKGKLID